MLRIRQAATLLLLAVLPTIAAAFFHPRKPSWQSDEVPLSVAQKWGDKVLWIDARTPKEFGERHIPGAVLLHQDTWDELLPGVLDAWDPDRIVVVYCSSLSCQASHEVAKRLREEVGLKDVRVLQGGWEAWLRAGP